MAKEMTTREAYVAVIEGNVNDEVIAKFETLLENMEKANAKKREKAAEKRAEKAKENEGLIAKIKDLLAEHDEGLTQTDIAEFINEGVEDEESKVSAQKCGRLAKEVEGVEQFTKRIDKRTVKAYKLG